MINIKTCGRAGCTFELMRRKRSVILIGTDKGTDQYIMGMADDVLQLNFDDIDLKGNVTTAKDRLKELDNKKNVIIPTAGHIQEALNWAGDKKDLIVCCHAGVSRSTAIAYLIACKYNFDDPYQAIKILDRRAHYPNNLMVKMGSELLNNPQIWNAYQEWIN